MPTPEHTRVYLEVGTRWVFAAALDWPGWCRRARGEEAALECLTGYAPRYAAVAGPTFAPGPLHVVARVPGTMTTDFGAPATLGPGDDEPLPSAEANRLVDLLEAAWAYFDHTASNAPAILNKGPRGGGRDRDGIVDHVRRAERSYGSKVGLRIASESPWDKQRHDLAQALRAGAPGGAWTAPYAIRRLAWHVLDHAWEIEDKSS